MRHLLMTVPGIAVLATASAVNAQSITPDQVTATMTVGQTITIDKTITLGPRGANLVDLFFLADNTGSMGGIITNAQNGATGILGAVPPGADYQFGAGSYLSDPCEPPMGPSGLCSFFAGDFPAYTEDAPLGNAASAQAGINSWTASGGGDTPEANFFALEQVANTADWRVGSQRIIVWFGDASSHTATTTQAEAIAALQGANATVIAFNSSSSGFGIDEGGQATAVVNATGGSLTNNFLGLTTQQFVDAVNAEIQTTTSSLDLVFGSTLAGSGLTLSFTCTDPLGCNDVGPSQSRTFQLAITANTPGVYDFNVFANGVSATEHDLITVVGSTGVVPEPSTWALLGTGLFGLGFMARRRKRIPAA